MGHVITYSCICFAHVTECSRHEDIRKKILSGKLCRCLCVWSIAAEHCAAFVCCPTERLPSESCLLRRCVTIVVRFYEIGPSVSEHYGTQLRTCQRYTQTIRVLQDSGAKWSWYF